MGLITKLNIAAVTLAVLAWSSHAAPIETVGVAVGNRTHAVDAMHGFLLRREASSGQTTRRLLQQFEQNPESIPAINDALDKIMQDIIGNHDRDEARIHARVAKFGECAAMPVVDQVANQNAVAKHALIQPANALLESKRTGQIKYDFGAEHPGLSANEADRVKTVIKDLQTAFQNALTARDNAVSAADDAQAESDAADVTRKEERDARYCTVRKDYDETVEDAQANYEHTVENLQHFKLIQCLMTEFGNDNKHDDAFEVCGNQTYSVEDSHLELKAAEAALPQDVHCSEKWVLLLENFEYHGKDVANAVKPLVSGHFSKFKFEHVSGYISCMADGRTSNADHQNCPWQACGCSNDEQFWEIRLSVNRDGFTGKIPVTNSRYGQEEPRTETDDIITSPYHTFPAEGCAGPVLGQMGNDIVCERPCTYIGSDETVSIGSANQGPWDESFPHNYANPAGGTHRINVWGVKSASCTAKDTWGFEGSDSRKCRKKATFDVSSYRQDFGCCGLVSHTTCADGFVQTFNPEARHCSRFRNNPTAYDTQGTFYTCTAP